MLKCFVVAVHALAFIIMAADLFMIEKKLREWIRVISGRLTVFPGWGLKLYQYLIAGFAIVYFVAFIRAL